MRTSSRLLPSAKNSSTDFTAPQRGYTLPASYKFNKTWFHHLINTRERKVTHPGFINLNKFKTYARNTYFTLLYLTLSTYPLKSLTIVHLASHNGRAAGIYVVLRGFPLLAFPSPPNNYSVSTPGMNIATHTKKIRRYHAHPFDVVSSCGVREEDTL